MWDELFRRIASLWPHWVIGTVLGVESESGVDAPQSILTSEMDAGFEFGAARHAKA
jgi:hypothetical protein